MSFDAKAILSNSQKTKNFILDLLFPIECLACKKEGVWLCKPCFRKLKFNQVQNCPICKKENQFGNFCFKCQSNVKKEIYLNGVWVAGDYNNKIIQKLIKTLKYKFSKDLSQILGLLLSLFLRNLINSGRLNLSDIIDKKREKIKNSPHIILDFKNTLLIPVPLHKKRERWRGFNQSEKIALVLAKKLNLKINKDLKRTKHKKAQAKLDKSAREKNVINCFSWFGKNLKNRNIILVDDVATTSSTLNECARILKNAGAREVWGLVVARG